MDKWCVGIHWDSAKDALLLHWRKLVSGLVIVVSIFAMGIIYLCATPARHEPTTACESSVSSAPEIPDTCPWHLVMSDLTHRLRLLEMAFKEQVIAREVIAAEVTNQSFSNLELERKLDEFVSAIKQLSNRLDKLKDQMSELSSRLYSDECLGFLVLIFVIVQIILALRTKIRDRQGQVQGVKVHVTQTHDGSTMTLPRSCWNNSINGVMPLPKQCVTFKQDACAVTFSKDSMDPLSAQMETLLTHVTEAIKFPIKQTYMVKSQEDLKECPRAKIYLVFVDCHSLSADSRADENGGGSDTCAQLQQHQNLELQLTSLRLLHQWGGQVIVVLTNEQGSQQLPDHALYNTSLPLIQSCDILQELASNGRLISIWKDCFPFQLNHVKKIGRSILSMKGK